MTMSAKEVAQEMTIHNDNGSGSNPHENSTYLPYYQHSPGIAACLILSYVFIFALCMVGNSLVCLTVLKDRRMWSVTNLFILNLAISDLLVGVFCIPTTLVDNLITGWPFNQTVCTISGLAQGMSVSASVFTLVAIAVDRFHCIVYPFRQKLSLFKATTTISAIWLLAIVIMCPSVVLLTVDHMKDHYMVYNEDYNQTYPLYTCYEAWPDGEMRKVYTTVLFVHIYFTPLMLILIMYGKIGLKLWSSTMPLPTENVGLNQDKRAPINKKKSKAIKMLIVVALLFMLSWLPLWTLMLLVDYASLDDDSLNLLTGYLFPFAHWLAFSNSTVNPIIYGYFNENFRRGFQAAFSFQLCSFKLDHKVTYSARMPGHIHFRMRSKVCSEVESSNTAFSRNTKNNSFFSSSSNQHRHQGLGLEDIGRISTNSEVMRAWENQRN